MAKFEKGNKAATGRPKGTPNKDTSKFKEALNVLFEENADQMVLWLAEIENPKDRFVILKDFAEFLYPKLSRADTKYEGEVSLKVNIKYPGE